MATEEWATTFTGPLGQGQAAVSWPPTVLPPGGADGKRVTAARLVRAGGPARPPGVLIGRGPAGRPPGQVSAGTGHRPAGAARHAAPLISQLG